MIRILRSPALPVRAAVHSGPFHADDVLCAALLYIMFGRENVEIIRTRDPEVLAGCQIVLDVGGKDEITDTRICLDHHQPGSLIRENGVKAAACGKLADLMFADEPLSPFSPCIDSRSSTAARILSRSQVSPVYE